MSEPQKNDEAPPVDYMSALVDAEQNDEEMQLLMQQLAAKRAAEAAAADPATREQSVSPWSWTAAKQRMAADFNNLPGADRVTPAPELSLAEKAAGRPSLAHMPQAIMHGIDKLDQAATRGIAAAGNEMGRTVVEVAGGVGKALGIDRLFGDEKSDEFRKWYAKPSNEWDLNLPGTDVAIIANNERFARYAGPRNEGVLGLVEGISQFSAAMATGGEFLKGLQALPWLGKSASALQNTKILKGGVQGMLADLTAFDPYEKRLSNLVRDMPDWFGKPVTDFLTAPFYTREGAEADGKMMARIRNAGEGFVTGTAMHGLMFGLKLMRLRSASKAGKMTKEALAEHMEALKEEFSDLFGKSAKEAGADGPARVAKAADGLHDVEVDVPHNEAPAAKPAVPEVKPDVPAGEFVPEHFTVAREGEKNVVRVEGQGGQTLDIQFDDPEFAQKVGDLKAKNPTSSNIPVGDVQLSQKEWSLFENEIMLKRSEKTGYEATNAATPSSKARNVVVESRHASRGKAEVEAASFNASVKNIQKSSENFVTPDVVKGFREAMDHYAATQDMRGAAEILDHYGFNPGYIKEPGEVISSLKALVDQMPEASAIARGKVQTHAETAELAQALFPHLDQGGALKRAEEMFGGAQKMPEMMLAMRAWQWFQARQVAKLAQLADHLPDNAKIVDQLMASMNTLFKVHAFSAGTMTKAAQTVNIGAYEGVGELASKLGQAQAAKKAVAAEGAQAVEGAARAEAGSAGEAAAGGVKPVTAESKLKEAVDTGMLSSRAPGTYDLAKGMTRQEVQALARLVALTDGEPEGMLKLIMGPQQKDFVNVARDPATKKSVGQFINNFRMEALLSAGVTHAGNFISNLNQAVRKPLERMYAGVQADDPALARQGVDMMQGMAMHLIDSTKLGLKAVKQGRNLFDASVGALESKQDIPALSMSAMKSGGFGYGLHVLATTNRRMLMASDEFFKQLSGRMYTHAQVLEQARAQGVTDPKELAQRVTDAMRVAFNPDGGAVYPDAIKYAKEAVFQADLGPHMRRFKEWAHGHELGRFIVPFLKTPMNIFMHSWQDAPVLNMLNKQMVTDLNAGGREGAVAAAKADFGATIYAIGASLALSGMVTGGGPTDPALRKQWLDAGNRPYSLVLGGKQISIRRGDPLTTGLGLIADLVHMSGELDERANSSAAGLIITLFSKNVADKTFMAGASDFLDAISSGKVRDANTFMANAVGSFAPNVGNRSNTDDIQREVVSLFDGFKAKTPGLSTTLEPRRNVFGEVVMKDPGWTNRAFNPFTVADVPKEGDVLNELTKLGKALPMPKESLGPNINLQDRDLWRNEDKKRNRQSPYDRWMELSGQPTPSMKPLREMLEAVTQKDEWKKMNAPNAYGPGGQKYLIVAQVVKSYQQAAFQMMLQEYPTLREQVIKEGVIKHLGPSQGPGAVSQAEELFK